jgi:hypothetical protein
VGSPVSVLSTRRALALAKPTSAFRQSRLQAGRLLSAQCRPLGLDTDGKTHASRFIPAESEQAARAAWLMNFHAVNVSDRDLRKVASKLPIGKIFVTGIHPTCAAFSVPARIGRNSLDCGA